MGRDKHSRKQRAEAARAAAARKLPPQPAKRDFLVDGRARFTAYLWAITLTFAYGVVNDLILGRPERRVEKEALFVCVATLVTHIFLFYTRPVRARILDRVIETLWTGIQNLVAWKYARIAGIIGPASVLVMSATPVASIEPTIAVKHLEKSDIGLIPGMDSDLSRSDPAHRFREVSGRIEKAMQERVPGDPNKVSEVKDSLARVVENVRLPENVSTAAKLELAYLQSYESLSVIGTKDPQILRQLNPHPVSGQPTVIGAGPDKSQLIMTPDNPGPFASTGPNPMLFTGFGVISFGHDPKLHPQFAVANGDNTAVVFNNVRVQGLEQDIGNLTWTNVTFVGCLIRYHGQPLRMGNVTFVNCTFERSPDGRGQALLDFLSANQGQPVSAYVSSSSR